MLFCALMVVKTSTNIVLTSKEIRNMVPISLMFLNTLMVKKNTTPGLSH